MSEEIAKLVVVADATSVDAASKKLDAFADAGARAAGAAGQLGQAQSQAAAGLAQTSQAAAQAGAATTLAGNAAQAATGSTGALGAAARTAAAGITQATTATTQNTTATNLNAAAHDRAARAGNSAAGSLAAVTRNAQGYSKSAKELAFATRNLPAQFTDIVVSLQAGQNPLTVLLQQGGQVKDMFGGVGRALKAVGGYVLGLINPITVAAGAVVALGVAYLKGDAEARAFAKTLELQGNALGISTNGMIQASEEMKRFGQTQGAAAAALNETAASGKIFGKSIETVAQAALNLEREGGQAIAKTVEDFASLAGGPVEAALKLDEKYKYLTATVYEQIAALEDQGDKMGAAELATNSLAGTINDRTANIKENLGVLEKAWRGIIGTAKAAWDAMLNVGRESSVSDKIIALNDKIRELNNPGLGTFGALLPKSMKDAKIQQFQTEIRALQVVHKTETEKAAKDRVVEEGRVAGLELAAYIRTGRTLAEQRKAAGATIREQARKERAAAYAKDRASDILEIDKRERDALATMERKMKDPKGPKAKVDHNAENALKSQLAEYERLKKAIAQNMAVSKLDQEQQEKLTSTQRFAQKVLADLAGGYTKLSPAQQATIKASLEELVAQDALNVALDKKNKLVEFNNAQSRDLEKNTRARATAAKRELDAMSMGSAQAAEKAKYYAIEDEYFQERQKLQDEYREKNALGSQEYTDQLARINDAEQENLNNLKGYYKARGAEQSDWKTGAKRAWDDFATKANDTAGQTYDAFTTAFGAMEGALDNFAKTGKFKFRDFANTIIAELTRIALKIALTKVLTSLFGDQNGTETYGGGGGGGGGNGYGPYANGGVFSAGSQVTPYASGGVVHSATLFPMARGGTGLMGEAGPEAIMPLTRMSDNKLGVHIKGGGDGGVNVTTIVNINKDGSSSSKSTSDDDAKQGKMLGDMLTMRVKEILVGEQRQGGILWSMANG